MENRDDVTLNGKTITAEQLSEKQKLAESQKGVQIEEVKKGDYRQKING